MATIIHVDGTTSPVTDMSLEGMQKVVGGYIEVVRIPGLSGGNKVMVVNEEGKLEDLPYNEAASNTCEQSIFGEAILTSVNIKGDLS